MRNKIVCFLVLGVAMQAPSFATTGERSHGQKTTDNIATLMEHTASEYQFGGKDRSKRTVVETILVMAALKRPLTTVIHHSTVSNRHDLAIPVQIATGCSRCPMI